MKEFSKEFYEKLLGAKSREEVETLLKSEEITEQTADEVWEQVQVLEISLDELEDVAGGKYESRSYDRDWFTEGCKATVETGSNCWGTDGGCDTLNITYYHMPNTHCPKCGRDCWNQYREYWCRSCGGFVTD